MCGLSVFVSSRPQAGAPDPDTIAAFTAALETMHHRGPDDTVVEYADGIAFGFKRLAIIDRAGSAQPVHYPAESGRWTVVCNGEIYNYRQLRTELIRTHGATFTTEGDAEVLAAALHYWGAAALPRLRGMFAFVAYDHWTGTVHAARDPFGIKPLYLLETMDGIFLSSERKALEAFAGNAAAALDTDALAHYLSFQFVPDPLTLHKQVKRLPPGHRLTWTPGGGLREERYFRPSLRPLHRPSDEAYEHIQWALRDSVRAHLQAEVPVGAFLSSGIDSTALVALARQEVPHLRVFTAAFTSEITAGYSEIDIAQDTADQLGVELIPAEITEDDVIRELPRIVHLLDDPMGDPSLIPLYFVARTASRYVTVALSGEGSDELFGGYTIYREPMSLAGINRLPAGMKRGLRGLSHVMPEGMRGRSFLERGTTPIEERYYGNARIFSPAEKADIMRFTAEPHTAVTAHLYAETADVDDSASMQYVDLHTWLPGDILTKADRMSMAHSLELRVPFLDPAVYAAAAGLPTELKLPAHQRTTKAALREAMRGIVPESVRDRPKLGFPTPTRVWLKGAIGDWIGGLLADSGAGHLLDLRYAQQLLADHRAGVADNSRKVWAVAMFCLWHAIEIERTINPAPADVYRPRLRQGAPLGHIAAA